MSLGGAGSDSAREPDPCPVLAPDAQTDQSVESEPRRGPGARFEALRSHGFLVLWLSEGLSLLGDRVAMIALVVLVYDRTGSAGAVGLLMTLRAIPPIALGGLAGVLVDRWNLRTTMVLSNLAQGLLVCLIPFMPGSWPIYAVYLAMAVLNQVFVPARSAAIPALVPAAALPSANALFAMGFVAAMALGPALGSALIAAGGLELAFYADALTFLVPAVAVGLIAIPDPRGPRPARTSLTEQLGEGLAYARSRGEVRLALASAAAAFLVIGTLSVCGVVVAKDLLHRESSSFGSLMSAVGAGMVLGGIAVGRLARALGRPRACLAGLTTMALALAGLPWSPSLAAAGAAAAAIGLGMVLVQANAQATLQAADPGLRGRLLGLSQTLIGGATLLASAGAGWAVGLLGAHLALGAVGAVVLAVALGLAATTDTRTPSGEQVLG